MYLGVAYYPEHWNKQDWERDASLMSEAGLNIVRLAEFAWSQCERTEGQFSFDWLDRVLDILAQRGLKALLCTPTATPPPWLTHKHPSILPVDQSGVAMSPGSRRHYCPSSPVYRDYASKIVQAMVDHVRDNETVVGWQIDNEFGCGNTARCYCDNCRTAFRKWLRKRYGSIDSLNEAWGTDVWSGVYTDWNEIPVPRKTTDPHHPSLLLDFYRFASDAVVEFQQLQVDIIKHAAPNHFVTHNMINSSQIDYYDLTKGLDFASWDSYPKPELQPTRAVARRVALWHDLFRGLKERNFWLLEQRCSSSRAKGGYAGPPEPGMVRLWTYQAIAHGADGVVFFRWRAARSGAEQCLGGLLSVDGRPTRAYDEVKQIGKELSVLAPQLRGTTVPTQVAITVSYPVQWTVAMQPSLFGPGFSFHEHTSKHHRGFFDATIPVSIVNPERSDPSTYRLVVVPTLFLTNEAILRNLSQYVEQGGMLVVTARSGVKDWNNKAVTTSLPGGLASLLKIRVDECDSLLNHGNEIKTTIPGLAADTYTCQTWCELIKSEGATVHARYTQGHFAGAAAITEASYGKGRALYVGAEIAEEHFYSGLTRWLAAEAGVQPLLAHAVDDVEVMRRAGPDTQLLFLLNHNLRETRAVNISTPHRSLLSNRVYASELTLAPGEVEVLAAL